VPHTKVNGGKPQINGKDLWQTADHRKKPVCTFLPASPAGGAGGSRWSYIFLHGADRIELKSGGGTPEMNQKD
jgi:hypothetical protein